MTDDQPGIADDDAERATWHRRFAGMANNRGWALSEQATLGLSIDNVMDVNYVPAGSRYPGPGRTILGSLQVKF